MKSFFNKMRNSNRVENCPLARSRPIFVEKKEVKKVETVSSFFSPTDEIPLKGMHILFADDSLDNQSIIEYFLSLNGAEVTLANNGSEAVEKALEGKFDLVLMDISMPLMDGYQATKLLLKHGYKAPIVALTGHDLKEDRERIIATGFRGHVSKPFDFSEFIQTISNVVVTC